MTDYSLIKRKVDEIYWEVVRIRRYLHQNPELSQYEKNTCAFIMNYLNNLGVPCSQVGGYGVMGTIKGSCFNQETMKTIAIRCDTDALPIDEDTGLPFSSNNPGVMHACGHDLHTAILLGTATLLKEIEGELNGAVRLLFQPAEETVGGAAAMIAAGCLESPCVSAALALHVEETLPLGTVQFGHGIIKAASCQFTITVNGRGCHGAHPHMGTDAILIAGNIITLIQSVVSRNIDPLSPAVITIGRIQGGFKGNVLASSVFMDGIIRTLDTKNMELIKKRIDDTCSSASASMGGSCQIKFKDGYPLLRNNPKLTEKMILISKNIFGKEKTSVTQTPSMGTDDFAYFSQAVPSVYFSVGASDFTLGSPASAHSCKFNPSEESMRQGMIMEIAGVLELLSESKSAHIMDD